MKWVHYTFLHAPFAKSLRSSHTVHTHYSNFTPPPPPLVSRGQPLSFWERVWSNAIEPSVLLTQHLTPLDHAFAHCGHPQLSWRPEQEALLHLTRLFPRRKEAGHARLPPPPKKKKKKKRKFLDRTLVLIMHLSP